MLRPASRRGLVQANDVRVAGAHGKVVPGDARLPPGQVLGGGVVAADRVYAADVGGERVCVSQVGAVERDADKVVGARAAGVGGGERKAHAADGRHVSGEVSRGAGELTQEDLERITDSVLAKLSEEVVREIAWEVVPDLAEAMVKERIRQLEDEDLPTRRS